MPMHLEVTYYPSIILMVIILSPVGSAYIRNYLVLTFEYSYDLFMKNSLHGLVSIMYVNNCQHIIISHNNDIVTSYHITKGNRIFYEPL